MIEELFNYHLNLFAVKKWPPNCWNEVIDPGLWFLLAWWAGTSAHHIGCKELKNWENCICLVVNLAIRLLSPQITQCHQFLWKNKKNYSIFQIDVKRNSENIIFWRGQCKSSIYSTWCQLKLDKWHERNKNGSWSKQNFQDLRKSMTSREVLKQNN